MPRPIERLSDKQCKKVQTKRGRLPDGGGLYLSFTSTGAKSWTFIWQSAGRFREMGLGTYPDVSLSQARELAQDLRKALKAGRDPIEDRRRGEAQAKTFGEVADAYVDDMEAGWSNLKHRAQWRYTLSDEYCRGLRKQPIANVSTEDVVAALKPIWQSKTETASRLRARIERVLDHAKAKGWRTGENPAAWRGHLALILPKPMKLAKRGHHAAMPYEAVPAFFSRLAIAEGLGARALQLTILSAARTSEVLNAEWSEFDLAGAVWVVPADRMKMRREHRVPLSNEAVTILEHVKSLQLSDQWVFPGQMRGKPLSNMALAAVLKRMEVDGVTVHGFRSAFRDWAGDATTFPRELAEAALAHKVGDATEAAYRRRDALKRRRELMQAWANFCIGAAP